MTDESDAVAMFALQGPRSETLLAGVVGADALPQARRNRLAAARYDGHALVVARTGYTGEATGFELFVDAQVALALWQRLVTAGAVAAGLGARDSLRLEAGLPLYGHELGTDRDGAEIPIFVNRLARYGVRKPGSGDYVGMQALDAQRAEYDAIVTGAMDRSAARWLRYLIQPLAAFGPRRPLRAGYELFVDGVQAGYVTSGTSVPIARLAAVGGHGEAAQADKSQYEMRPVGLALVRSDVRYRADAPVRFDVRAARQTVMEAYLVERNFPAPAIPTVPSGA
jgi:aminomethyltransferase